MAKILAFSDLHLNFFSNNGKSILESLYIKDVDVGVCAGDLTTGINNLENAIIQLCDMYPQFVYVSGNHEYFGSNFKEIDDMLGNLAAVMPNFHWLNNKRVSVSGVNFIGATLWYPPTVAAQINKKHFCDFYCIEKADPEIFDRNAQTIDFFKKNMCAGDYVISHQMPSRRCIVPKFKGDAFNCFFVNDLDMLILEKEPKIYLMGHGHTNQDFTIGPTRLVCNPRGYENENPMFDPSLIMEV